MGCIAYKCAELAESSSVKSDEGESYNVIDPTFLPYVVVPITLTGIKGFKPFIIISLADAVLPEVNIYN